MCCCCPPAINALFCLWFQSGCSKGSVAGALTFFPPDPPLYKFERYNTNGEPLPDDDDYDEEITRENGTTPEANRSNGRAAMHEQDNDEDIVMGPTGHVVPLEEKRMSRGDDHETSNENPANASTAAQQLVERARQLRQRAKVRNLRDAKDRAAGITYRVSLDRRLLRSASLPPTLEAIKLPTSSSSGGSHVAVLVYRVSRPNERTKTIIYSHGNATDIGAMFPTQSLLVQALEANVVCFDYSGYGESGGVAEELNTYSDIRAVYKYCVENISPNPKNIVLYGQSVGSGPVCNLAYKNKNLGGIILHSPFTSGMRVLTPSRLLACLDIYPNINRIKYVKCPVMVIHGRRDEEVHFHHGREMYEAIPEQYKREPWWVSDRGHNDITEGSSKLEEYIRKLRQFLSSLDSEL